MACVLTLFASADADRRDMYVADSAAWPTAPPMAARSAAPPAAAAFAAVPMADFTALGICFRPLSKLLAASLATAFSFGARSFTAPAAVEVTGDRTALAVFATDFSGCGMASAALFITDLPALSALERPDFTAPVTPESLEDTELAMGENAAVMELAAPFADEVSLLKALLCENAWERRLPDSSKAMPM